MSYSLTQHAPFFGVLPAQGERLQEIVWKLKRGEFKVLGRPVPEEHIPYMLADIDFKKLYEEICEDMDDFGCEYRPPIQLLTRGDDLQQVAPEWKGQEGY